MKRILEEIEKTFTARRILIAFILVVVFFTKESWIVSLIDKVLLVPKDFSNPLLDVLFIIASIWISLWFIYLFRRKVYKASYTQIISVLAVIFLLIYFYFSRKNYNWNYHALFDTNFEYIWLIVIPLSTFLFIHFYSCLIPVKKITRELLPEYRLTSDNPKENDERDLLGYDRVVEKLYQILINQESKKSLTIGLVGPWGNGKSSIIQMLLDKLKPIQSFEERVKNILKKELIDDYLIIHFLPYLNHQEEDIIKEFFRGLSGQLRPYNGKLSNLVLEYSKRLVDLYKNKANLNFFEKHITSFDKTSAKEMYDDINERLKETGKKIIVFVDDLDRLNAKEILQVLKLIRNSADFTNVIFLVAMDKEYIVKLLTGKKEILNARFIDKFFQLEVFLPAIRKESLRTIFKELLTERTQQFNSEFPYQLEEALNHQDNLFDDYIHNLRDVKRAVNQIVLEYSYTKGAINLKDFINFIYLKLKYPHFIKVLQENKSKLLKYDKEKDMVILDTNQDLESSDDLLNYFRYESNFDYKILDKYSLYKDFELKDGKDDHYSRYSHDDKVLIIKTLAYLFGEENKTEDIKSIKRLSNFNMIIEQRLFENYLGDNEFNDLFNYRGQTLKDLVKNKFENDKLSQLLDRIAFYKPDSLAKLKTIFETLVYVYESRNEYNQYEDTLFRELAAKVQFFIDRDEFDNNELKTILKKNLFENQVLSFETRIRLLAALWEEKQVNGLWGLEPKYILDSSVKLYEEFLEKYKEDLWEHDNYTFYHIGQKLSRIDNLKNKIAILTEEFWNSQDIELLCVQSINIEPWSIKGFTLSDGVEYAFNSKKDFVKFVKNHEHSRTPEMNELKKFFDLYKRRNYRGVVLFTFEKSEMMKKKIDSQRNNPQFTREEYEGSKQLFFETDYLDLEKDWQENRSLYTQEDFLNIQFTMIDEKLSMFMATTEEGIEHLKNKRLPFILNRILELEGKEIELKLKKENFKEDNDFLPEDSDYYFKLISEQPKS